MTTLQTILDRVNVTAADRSLADIAVPVLTGPQRQGDVMIVPRARLGAAERGAMTVVPSAGVPVVRGEATGNAHILHADGVVMWAPSTDRVGVRLGVLHVADGAVAWLIHTDEHGANGIGPGTYILTGKREQADELRRVAD